MIVRINLCAKKKEEKERWYRLQWRYNNSNIGYAGGITYDLLGLCCCVPITATHHSFAVLMALVFDVWHYLSRICLRVKKRVQQCLVSCIRRMTFLFFICIASNRQDLLPMTVVHRCYGYTIISKRENATFGVPLISVLVIFDLHFFQRSREDT